MSIGTSVVSESIARGIVSGLPRWSRASLRAPPRSGLRPAAVDACDQPVRSRPRSSKGARYARSVLARVPLRILASPGIDAEAHVAMAVDDHLPTTVDRVDRLQARLGAALAANRPLSGIDHVMVILPSFSVNESILSHYGDRIPSLEHRYLNALLVASRITDCEIIHVSTRLPEPTVLDYLFGLVPADRRAEVRSRVRLIDVDDGTTRSVAMKLLDRPDLLADIRGRVGERPALIEPWNVTEHEIALALAINVPINGTRPELRGLGFKSEGRRLLARAGIPIPLGREDVRTIDDVVGAALAIRSEHPTALGVVVKHDDSGAGDGNVVIDFAGLPDAGHDPNGGDGSDPGGWLRERVEALPDWYLSDLKRGGIVEERVGGRRFTSPSAQVDIRPGGEVVVLATHEQVLGGPSNQVYLGCRFPADPAYAPELATHAAAAGRELADRGAVGRFSLDFVAAGDDADAARSMSGTWRVYGLEINLRKGGTTHPYAALRNVVPGRYDAGAGRWIAEDGSTRVYSATDNLVEPTWTGLSSADVIRVVSEAGLQLDSATGTGVVLHMLSGLAIDGRFGLTAIARTADEADAMQAGVRHAVERIAERRPGSH